MNAIHLYQHPDGSFIDFDYDTGMLMAYEDAGPTVGVPIGPIGMIELGQRLMAIGKSMASEVAS